MRTLARYEPNSAARSQSVLNLGNGISCANKIINGGLRSIRTYFNAIADVACRFAGISKVPVASHFDILYINAALCRFTVNIVVKHTPTVGQPPEVVARPKRCVAQSRSRTDAPACVAL